MLSYAFIDQLYFGELPCPLCLMQRIGFVIIGCALVLNIRCGAHSSHYGCGIVGGLVGMMVSLRQVLYMFCLAIQCLVKLFWNCIFMLGVMLAIPVFYWD
ncbi:disulfide bond formation protein B [Polynucleobacter necessarius]|uniref:disulfide bond formation protein B n=1 Tax=Polynucleobacter necessarius TaxID=576610 RepID=UPI0039E47A15